MLGRWWDLERLPERRNILYELHHKQGPATAKLHPFWVSMRRRCLFARATRALQRDQTTAKVGWTEWFDAGTEAGTVGGTERRRNHPRDGRRIWTEKREKRFLIHYKLLEKVKL